jgi:hypothetical protein
MNGSSVERDKEEDGFAHQDGQRARNRPLLGGAHLTIEPGSDFPIGVICGPNQRDVG